MRLILDYILYENPTNGYMVARYKDTETGKKIVCVGNNLPVYKIPYDCELEETVSQKYGKQFKITSYKESVDSQKKSVIDYLSCGLFKGIGKKTAEKIYEKFEDQTLYVMENAIDKLLLIKGITPKKLEIIRSSYESAHKYREINEFLGPIGISPRMCNKIYDIIISWNVLPEKVIDYLKAYPYRLCDIDGVTFETADRIGRSFNVSLDNPDRIFAGAREAIRYNIMTGTVGIEIPVLEQKMAKILNLPYSQAQSASVIHKHVMGFLKKGDLEYRKVDDNGKILTYVYLKSFLRIENELSECVVRLLKNQSCKRYSRDVIDPLIEKYTDIDLDESQKEAIRGAFCNDLTIITGGPGTGKTTIVKVISKIERHLDPAKEQVFLAPTGRAARRITESTGERASTIHSRLKLLAQNEDKKYEDKGEFIEDSFVLIDEFSMVDMCLAHILFDNLIRCRIVIVGDTDQLMSVGAGSVLYDFIKCGAIPTFRLNFTHRQAQGSLVSENANLIRQGITIPVIGDDYEFVEVGDNCNVDGYLKGVEDILVEQTMKEIDKYGIDNVICVVPYKNYEAGVWSLNKRLQERINPLREGDVTIGSSIDEFRPRDIVMHLKNSDSVLNGDIGVVKGITEVDGVKYMHVEYTGEAGEPVWMEYTKQDLDEVTLAYAMTVHKSQGCEYKSVVTCITNFHKFGKKRNLIYTAITRAKDKVTVVASKEAYAEAILNDAIEERNTLLAYNISKEMDGLTGYLHEETYVKEEVVEDKPEYEQLTLDFTKPA